MENASKALIIAGAILLSISIIGIGMFVFNMATEATKNINMSSQEIAAYNGEFDKYQGTQRGTSVKTLFDVVRNHNLANRDDVSKQIQVVNSDATGMVAVSDSAEASTGYVANGSPSAINTKKQGIISGGTYKITFGYDKNSGLIIAVGYEKLP